MPRPYAVKGKKRKKGERYDRDEEGEEGIQLQHIEDAEEPKMTPSEATSNGEEETKPVTEMVDPIDFEGIPLTPSTQNVNNDAGVTFILEKASLEVAKVGKVFQLLNSDDHAHFLKRNNKDPAAYRPDILHQALLMVLDSPLNKAGKLKAVYVRTEKGALIEIKPNVRIPRTFKRFAGIMLQLLQKLSITASGKREKLLRVIRNPVTQYLPVNSYKIGLSHSSQKLVNMRDYTTTFGSDRHLVFVVGAMAHGKIESDYIDDYIAVSGYPLSAAYCITMICQALEAKWKIL